MHGNLHQYHGWGQILSSKNKKIEKKARDQSPLPNISHNNERSVTITTDQPQLRQISHNYDRSVTITAT